MTEPFQQDSPEGAMGASDWLAAGLAAIERKGLRRFPVTLQSAPGPEINIDGRPVLSFCSNDYLGLAGDARLRAAAAGAANQWGAGSGASRLVSGTSELHRRLEHDLASLKHCESAILFSSGYLANTGTIPALAGVEDAIFSDELNHASLIDGIRLSRASSLVFGHRDYRHLEKLLGETQARRRLIVTDTVFSMDGDVANLRVLKDLAGRYDAMLMVDEAHATGVLGPSGGGAVEAAGLQGQVDVVMGTLSKALGSAGGFVAGSAALVEYLRNRARTYIFDTAPAPASMGAAIEAVRLVHEEAHRRSRVLSLARRLADGLVQLGYRVGAPAAAILPVMIGRADEAMSLSSSLLDDAIFIPAIRPPSVAEGACRLRATVTAAHTDDHVDRALEAFARRSPAGAAVAPPLRSRRNPTAADQSSAGIDPAILRAKGLFITGTDTGVGKTVAAAIIARCMRRAGLRVAALKPVQTGTATDPTDISFLSDSGDLEPGGTCSVYEFAEPLAPMVAAERAGQMIHIEQIAAAFESLRSRFDLVIVEGAGGILVPVTARGANVEGSVTMADLAGLLQVPILIVVRPSLGTLNHTALTIEAARRRGLDVLGVVVNRFPPNPSAAEASNPGQIERLCRTTLAGVVPELPGEPLRRLDPGLDVLGWMGPLFAGRFDRSRFLENSRMELTHC